VRVLAVIVACACVALTGGCALTPTTDPMGARQRSQIRESVLENRWSDVRKAFPDALRPTVSTMHTVTDHDRAEVILDCLRRSGIPATPTDNGFRYNSSLGQSQLEFVETSYACSASFPAESEVVSYLIGPQRMALSDYKRNVVRPCLLSAGVASPAPPEAGSARPALGSSQWSPYRSVWSSNPSAGTLAYLERRCPPLPAWLDLSP
jgi:hypothetical protein